MEGFGMLGKIYLSNKEIFAIIKEANQYVDLMEGLDTDSKAYADLSECLMYTLDIFNDCFRRDFQLHLSKRTGHYFVTFAK